MNTLEQQKIYNPSHLLHAVFDEVTKNIGNRGTTPELPTGLAELDEAIWGLHRKQLTVLAARPSHGKTSLALQIAVNLSRLNLKTMFISYEMSVQDLVERIVCNQRKINGWRLRKGMEEEKKAFSDIGTQDTMSIFFDHANLFIEDSFGRTEAQLEAILNITNFDVVIIDHAQCISSEGFNSKYEALSSYVQFLKRSAIKYNCAILLNSQINRTGAELEDSINNLKGSGELEEGADTVVQLRWLFRHDPDEYRDDPHKYEFKVLKQRHGATGTGYLDYQAQFFKFDDYLEKEVSDEN